MSRSPDPNPLTPIIRAALEALAPSPDALLRWLAPQVSDDMLAEIAVADYGMEVDANMATLRRLRDIGVVPAPLRWEPREVLELTRWSRPDDFTSNFGSRGERGHLIRAFCCTTLLRGAVDPANAGYFDGENQNIILLIASALTLGEHALRGTLQLLVWCLLEAPGPLYERPFFALGVLLLVVTLRHDQQGELLNDLCDWVFAEEAWTREQGVPGPTSDAWLLGLTFFDHTDMWREVGWRVLVEPPVPHPSLAADALNAIATQLITGFED